MLASYELQGAIISALSVFDTPIYDSVPQDAELPYIRYDSDIEVDNSTKTEKHVNIDVYINVFHDDVSKKIVKQIASQVVTELELMDGNVGAYHIDSVRVETVRAQTIDKVHQITIITSFKLSK